MHELRQTIHRMKPSWTAGINGISIHLIKDLWKELEVCILNMVNLSISSQIYPSTLKQSKIIPFLKHSTPPKPPTDPGSYRGINLLMSLGICLDKIVLKQTLEYLIENSLVHHAHHGSLKGCSTTTAVVTLMDTWSELIKERKEVAAIALDQSCAYNLIDHKILIAKIKLLAFQPSAIEWYTDYLSNQSQQVYTDGAYSNSLHIDAKYVIQGSVMLHMMYLIYILDLPLLFSEDPDPISSQLE